MQEENISNIKDNLIIIRKRIVLILLITVCSMLAVTIYSFYIQKPVYEAKSTIIVGKDSSGNITQSEVAMYEDLTKTYSEIGKSRVVAKNAAERLNSVTLVDELMANVNITPQSGTQIIDITYKGNTPEIAAERANAMLDAFVEESQKLLPSGSAKIMDKAEIPKTAITPNKTLDITLSFVVGLILSFGIVFLIEYLNNSIKNEDDIERYLEMHMVGSIPKVNKTVNLIVEKESESITSEAFKAMRTNLLFSLGNKGVKTLMVCSSCPKEGKTSVSTNIASVIAQTGKRVLLVDCDFRKPSVHRHFNISNEIGLVDVVLKGENVGEITTKINNNFDILPAGKVNYNPSELLSSQKMKAMINEMEHEYDYIILDTAPIIAFTDALTLITEKIGVLLVISSQESKIEVCKKTRQLLTNMNATLIGAVLNKVDKSSFLGYGYDYYSYGKEKTKKNRKLNSIKTAMRS